MAKENSFDIVSKTDYAEVGNALNQTAKEISQRFDFKGSSATVERMVRTRPSCAGETRMKRPLSGGGALRKQTT